MKNYVTIGALVVGGLLFLLGGSIWGALAVVLGAYLYGVLVGVREGFKRGEEASDSRWSALVLG